MPKKSAAPVAVANHEFLINRKTLADLCVQVSRAVSSRPSHPVLGNIRIWADPEDQKITLSATDMAIALDLSASAEVRGTSVAICLPAKLLCDLVQKLPDGMTVIEIHDEFKSVLQSQSSRYSIQGMGDEDFATISDDDDAQYDFFELTPAPLVALFRAVLYSVSCDETKQILTGVHLTVFRDSNGAPLEIEMAATDGHRLAIARVRTEQKDEDPETPAEPDPEQTLKFVVPGKLCRELERQVGGLGSEVIRIGLSKHNQASLICFCWSDFSLTGRRIDGLYPAYQQLVPVQFARQVTVNRKTLLDALDRISVIADQKSNHIVRFAFNEEDGDFLISANAQDMGDGVEEITDAQIAFDDPSTPFDIGFNVKYLIDSLKHISTTEVQLNMNTPTSPVVIKPLGGSVETHLVMPVQVRS